MNLCMINSLLSIRNFWILLSQMKSRHSLDYNLPKDSYSIDEYKRIFFDFLLETPEILEQNHISIDLLPDNPKTGGWANTTESMINLIDNHPNVFSYSRSGYLIEIREVRYLT